MFKFPHARDIWQSYINRFIEKYQDSKLDRARDIFEQVLNVAPPAECMTFYLQYAKLEEQFGLTKRVMLIYERAAISVPKDQRLSVYELYLKKAQEHYGLTKMREVYETAIEADGPHGLSDKDVKYLCMRYAQLEQKLGEIDRARAIFFHASNLADPKEDKLFWEEWKQFEVQHGNLDTFRDMLYEKKSVGASYSTLDRRDLCYVRQTTTDLASKRETLGKRKLKGMHDVASNVFVKQ